jgi:ribosomal protein S18 acetylase RimI-like enzyme
MTALIQAIEANLSLESDSQAIVNLLNEYALDPMGGGEELSLFAKENLIKELQKHNRAYVILGQVDGIHAGLVICLEGFSTFACRPLLNIHDVVVSQPYRGRGLSKIMFAKAEEIANRLGCCKITLEVLEGNTTAQAAYRSCGFAPYELAPATGKALFWQKKLD